MKKIKYKLSWLTWFTWNKPLYCFCSKKTKIWACYCCRAWVAWLCWTCICWFCIMIWLYCLFRDSISLFSSCKSSDLNSRSCSSFCRRKSTTPSTTFLSPVSLSSCSSRFFVSPIFPLAFSNFLNFLFFVLDIDCLFWVSALVLHLLSSDTSIMFSGSCLFSDSSSPPRPVFLISSLALTCTFSWG